MGVWVCYVWLVIGGHGTYAEGGPCESYGVQTYRHTEDNLFFGQGGGEAREGKGNIDT